MKKMSAVMNKKKEKKNNLKKFVIQKKNLVSFPSGAIKTLFSFGPFVYL